MRLTWPELYAVKERSIGCIEQAANGCLNVERTKMKGGCKRDRIIRTGESLLMRARLCLCSVCPKASFHRFRVEDCQRASLPLVAGCLVLAVSCFVDQLLLRITMTLARELRSPRISAPSKMHRSLHVPGIVWMIVAQLDRRSREGRAAAALARCRIFHAPALDVSWRARYDSEPH